MGPWLPGMDLNHRMEASEAPALPLGDPGMVQLLRMISWRASTCDFAHQMSPSDCDNLDIAFGGFRGDCRGDHHLCDLSVRPGAFPSISLAHTRYTCSRVRPLRVGGALSYSYNGPRARAFRATSAFLLAECRLGGPLSARSRRQSRSVPGTPGTSVLLHKNAQPRSSHSAAAGHGLEFWARYCRA